jgi:hypothetical protein
MIAGASIESPPSVAPPGASPWAQANDSDSHAKQESRRIRVRKTTSRTCTETTHEVYQAVRPDETCDNVR